MESTGSCAQSDSSNCGETCNENENDNDDNDNPDNNNLNKQKCNNNKFDNHRKTVTPEKRILFSVYFDDSMLSTDGKKPWTKEEDEKLLEVIYSNYSTPKKNEISWAKIQEIVEELYFKGIMRRRRTGKQCRERWLFHLSNPALERGPFTEEEDKLLLELNKKHGNKWKVISSLMKNRTEHHIKNRYYTILRKEGRKKIKDSKSKSYGSDTTDSSKNAMDIVSESDNIQDDDYSSLTFRDMNNFDKPDTISSASKAVISSNYSAFKPYSQIAKN